MGSSYAQALESYVRYVERLEAAVLSVDPKRILLAQRMVKRRKKQEKSA